MPGLWTSAATASAPADTAATFDIALLDSEEDDEGDEEEEAGGD